MKKSVLVVLADGFEEIEAVTPIDILRRAGLDVTVAGLDKLEVAGQSGLKIRADLTLDRFEGLPDAVVLPGGAQGASNLGASSSLSALLVKMREKKRLIAAICAAPALVLARQGFLNGRKATAYPGYEKNFSSEIAFSDARVVVDGDLVTSRGPGTALEFSLELVRRLVDDKTAADILAKTLARV
jgi:4-methyl-5(b-hydroxyethyl)-thiazole monophosphate biosynthesis